MRRLIAAFPGALLVSAGLVVYRFTAVKTHFMVVSTRTRHNCAGKELTREKKPLVGVAIFSVGTTNVYVCYPWSSSIISCVYVLTRS